MLGMNHVAALLEHWAAEASALSNRYGQDGLALLTTQHIAELEQALREDADEPLTLTEAAKVCGFSDDHLGRLVRQGKLTNVGRRNAPRVRRGDLPTKVRRSDLRESSPSLKVPSTRMQIAQAVVDRQ